MENRIIEHGIIVVPLCFVNQTLDTSNGRLYVARAIPVSHRRVKCEMHRQNLHVELGSRLIMETLDSHVVEHVLRAAAPRRVRLAAGSVLLIACAAVVLFLLIIAGIRSLGEAGRLIALELLGRNSVGQVAAVRYQDGKVGTLGLEPVDAIVAVRYTYPMKGLPKPGAGVAVRLDSAGPPSDPTANQKPAPAQPMQTDFCVRYLALGALSTSEPWHGVPLGRIVFYLAAGLIVAGFAAHLAWRVGKWTVSAVAWVRDGCVSIGTVLDKTCTNNDNLHYYVRYGYADNDGITYESQEACSTELWRELRIGQSITVLYAADDPSRSALYALLPIVAQRLR